MAKTDSYLANSISKIISDKKQLIKRPSILSFNHPNSNNLNLIGISKLSHIEQIEIIKKLRKHNAQKIYLYPVKEINCIYL